MSSRNEVTVGPTETVKRFTQPERFEIALQCFRDLPWATPRLIGFEENVLIMETLEPALDLPEWNAREDMMKLLNRIHESGLNHMDVHLGNLVRCPDRGPVLIDWEWATGEVGELSYDLHGPDGSGIRMPHQKRGIEMWVGAHHPLAIDVAWRVQ